MTDHIRVREEDGHVVVTIDDWEVFDYVEDFLAEERDLEYDYFRKSVEGGFEFFSMHFPPSASLERVSAAIAELPGEEIERIWRVNNTA